MYEDGNNMDAPCAIGAIFLGPTGNIQGTYSFMNLKTEREIFRNSFIELPTPEHVIDCIQALARKDKATA